MEELTILSAAEQAVEAAAELISLVLRSLDRETMDLLIEDAIATGG